MSNIGFRIRNNFERPPMALIRQAGELSTPNLGDVMNRTQCMSAGIRPFGKPGVKLAGPAFTVKTRAGDNLMLHKALDLARPGDVIVADAGGDMSQSLLGELMARYALTLGLAGIVIDGPIRDVAGLSQLELPIYARGATPGGPYKDGPGEIGFSVTCGGVIVKPGDIIVGDEDGIAVIPREEAESIIKSAQVHHQKEIQIMEEIARGKWDRSWVDKTLQAKGCEFVER